MVGVVRLSPPDVVSFPSGLSLYRLPQSLNVDLEDPERGDDDPEMARAVVGCVLGDGAQSLSPPRAGEAGASATALPLLWFVVDSVLLFVTAVRDGTVEGAAGISRIEADEGLAAAVAAGTLPAYVAISKTTLRRYSPEDTGTGGSSSSSPARSHQAPYDEAFNPETGESRLPPADTDSPSPGRKAKDRLTSAVAFDFVSGIMNTVISDKSPEDTQ